MVEQEAKRLVCARCGLGLALASPKSVGKFSWFWRSRHNSRTAGAGWLGRSLDLCVECADDFPEALEAFLKATH